MKLVEFLPYLQGVKQTTSGYVGRCPAHDDRHPSFVVTEVDDRILVHCRAGCGTRDVLSAMDLDYPDLFLDYGKTKKVSPLISPRPSDREPSFHWNWRSQCAELERLIQGNRERAEAMLQATHGLDVNALTAPEFDEVMDFVVRAYAWLERCERLDETLFLVQQTMRIEERAERVKKRKVQVAV